MSKAKLRVNDVRMRWNDSDAGEWRYCHGCYQPTQGIANLESPLKGFSNIPYCISCAIGITFQTAEVAPDTETASAPRKRPRK
jgi:hypothetical protein